MLGKRVLDALTEDLGSTLSTHLATQPPLTPVPGYPSNALFWPPGAPGIEIRLRKQDIHTYTIEINNPLGMARTESKLICLPEVEALYVCLKLWGW